MSAQNMDKTYIRVLTIAGSDSGGGAGIQADLKTFSALGGYGMSVITALTAQNTLGVTAIHAVPPEFVAAQIDAVLADIGVDGVKIGMLYSPELMEIVACKLTEHGVENVVFDPVMVAQSGDPLLESKAVDTLCKIMIPIARLVTPNIPEAEILTGMRIRSWDAMAEAAKTIASMGCPNVLVKGGHLASSDVIKDVLYNQPENRLQIFESKRVDTRNNHGTGCTLSSAITVFLAKKHGIEDAVKLARTYLHRALTEGAAYGIGHGHGPVHHFHPFWK